MLLRSSLIRGSIGLVFLVTAVRGRRPLTLAALQSVVPGKAEQAQREYDTDPGVRHGHRLASTVWGVALLAEAIVRIPLVYLLPVEIAVGATEALFIGTFVLLMTRNGWYVAHARRSAGDPHRCA